MALIPAIRVNISVVIGSTSMPIKQLLKMGRGAIVALNSKLSDPVDIFANDELVARGEIMVAGDKVKIKITERLGRKQPVIG